MKVTFKNAWGYQGDNMNLPVADIETAAPFYEAILGFHVVSPDGSPAEAREPHKKILERDGIQIGLAEIGGDPTQDGCAFEVENVEALHAEFKAKGLDKEISKLDIENRDDGSSWKVFFVVAPDGLCYWFGERQ